MATTCTHEKYINYDKNIELNMTYSYALQS